MPASRHSGVNVLLFLALGVTPVDLAPPCALAPRAPAPTARGAASPGPPPPSQSCGCVTARNLPLVGLRGGGQPEGAAGSGRRARGGYLRGRGGRGAHGRGGGRGGGSHRPGAAATARDIRRGGDDSVLCHFLGKETYIKCEGRREFIGTVLSYDSYGNLMVDNTTEMIMEYTDEDDEYAVRTKHTRFLGLTVCHGKNILGMWPTEGSRDIDDPFPDHENPGLAESGVPLDPDEDLPPRPDASFADMSSDHEWPGMPGTSTQIPGVHDISLEHLAQLGGDWIHADGGLEALNVSLAAKVAPPGLKQLIL